MPRFRVSLRICPAPKKPLGRDRVGSDFPSNESDLGGRAKIQGN